MHAAEKTDVIAAQGSSVLDRVGNTPLLRLTRVGREFPHVEFYAKAEWFNPGGSVKDRPALNMILDGERSGKLRPGKIILDATSGNTGIAYAMVGAARGYKVRLCMPANASMERKRILRAYGAELLLTDPAEGSDGAIRKAKAVYAKEPDSYFYPDQYNNPANWQAHYHGTAAEIWEQSGGRVTHFVAGLGTSGTFVGTTRRLKELNPKIRCISLQPDGPFHGLEGWKHMPTAIVPGIYDPSLADENLPVRTEDAYGMVKALAREEGLLASPSAGGALWGAFEVAKGISQSLSRACPELSRGTEPRGQNAVIVIIFPDGGDKYLSERFWDEDV